MKKNWMLIVGILFAIDALALISNNIGAAVISLIIAGVFIFFWLKKKKASGAKSAEPPAPVQKAAAPMPKPERTATTHEAVDSEAAADSKVKNYRITGTSHYQDAFKRLAIKNPEYAMSKKELIDAGMADESVYQYCFQPVKVELVPESENPYDPNAIKVVVDGEHIGYIKKGSCAHLLKVINGNRIEKISARLYGGKYKYITSYDDDESRTTYELEYDTSEFYANIEVIEKAE